MSDKKINVLLFGLGAIGGFYAFVLNRSENVSLTVVARSNYEAVKKDGLRIQSENHGEHVVHPDEVVDSPSKSTKSNFDFILCTNKAINPQCVPPLFKTITSSSTTFVIIQNGVGNEEPFRNQYPHNTIISCVTWVGAGQPSPGLIKHTKSEDTQIGLFPNPTLDAAVEKQRLEGFASLLKAGGTTCSIEENIQIARWGKVVWNAAWNSLTTLTGADTQSWLASSPHSSPITRQLMLDVILVAQKCGVPLKDELVERLFEKINAMPGIYSSMYVDSKAGRSLEVDVILGFPMRKAVELGLEAEVPTLRAVFAMVAAVDGRLRREAAEH